ncbi:Bet_v_1 domain-containing protein [Psidium guajava]|nr:Bet_v_1 domain-containing protein [Psidium guajava]
MIVCKDLFAGAVVVVSIVILLALFSIQQFGTRKVGFLFASILALWFFCLGSIGLYNLLKHDIIVLRAVNPTHIYFFFKKNSGAAWSALGGCVLCITGTFQLLN